MADGVVERCPFCEMSLVFEVDGKRMRFIAHDDNFCKYTMLETIRTLRRVFEDTSKWSAEREGSTWRHVGELQARVDELERDVVDLERDLSQLR